MTGTVERVQMVNIYTSTGEKHGQTQMVIIRDEHGKLHRQFVREGLELKVGMVLHAQ